MNTLARSLVYCILALLLLATTVSAQQCSLDLACPQPRCVSGSTCCPVYDCVGGQCVTSNCNTQTTTVSEPQCSSTKPCPLPPCAAPMPGTTTCCPTPRCEQGQCVMSSCDSVAPAPTTTVSEPTRNNDCTLTGCPQLMIACMAGSCCPTSMCVAGTCVRSTCPPGTSTPASTAESRSTSPVISPTRTVNPDCANLMCPAIACEGIFAASTTTCCPSCLPRSTCTACPVAPSCDLTTSTPVKDACGCVTCQRKAVCNTLLPCLACPSGTIGVTAPDSCCPVCQVPPRCSNVACAQIACGANSRQVTLDGQCCPSCVPMFNNCSAVACAAVACPLGTKTATVDGSCCPQCLPQNPCAAVLCPLPACRLSLTTVRSGNCCPQCSTSCLSQETDRRVCNQDDQLVCRPGLWSGPDCTVPAPVGSARTLLVRVPAALTANITEAIDLKFWLLSQMPTVLREQLFVAPASNPSGGQRQSGTAYQVTVSSTDPNAAPNLAATTQNTAQASGLSAAPASPSSSGLSGGAIAGIVIGCLIVVGLIVAIIVVVVVLPQRKEAAKNDYQINT